MTAAARGGEQPGLSVLLMVALLLLGGAPAAAGADEAEALAWLDRMAEASQRLNYDGVFVYRHGDEIETMRVIHRGGEEGELERLVSLNGAPREVLRDASRVTCIRTDERSVRVGPSHPRGVLASVFRDSDGRFTDYYDLRLSGRDRVAGRPARELAIMPRDDYRYGYRLWLDEATGLALRSELLHPDGTPIEQLVYTSLSFPAHIPDALLEPSVSGDNFVWLRAEGAPDAPDALATPPRKWRVQWLPEGFEMKRSASDPMVYASRPVRHMVFSDGLASFSVYVERLDEDPEPFLGRSRMGAVNAYGGLVDGHQVTVVGEVPEATVHRVAREVTRID